MTITLLMAISGATLAGGIPDPVESHRTTSWDFCSLSRQETGTGCTPFDSTNHDVHDAIAALRADEEWRHAEDNLYTQRRMATAAEWMWGLTVGQMILTLTGTIAILVTLRFTRETARAAVQATTSANEAIAQTERHARRQMRAYVGAHDIVVSDFRPGLSPVFKYNPTNTGQTPAYDLSIKTVVIVTNEDPEICKIHFPHLKRTSRITLGSEQLVSQESKGESNLSHELYSACLTREAYFVIAGCMRYRDIFNSWHTTTFSAYVDPLLLKGGAGKLTSTSKHNRAN